MTARDGGWPTSSSRRALWTGGELFTLARDGRVVRSFDPFDVRVGGYGDGAALDEEADLDWGLLPVSGLLLMARVTGTPPAELSWLSRPGVQFIGVTRE